MITFREKIASVAKRYEKQATIKKVAAVSAKNTKPVSKDFNHESQA
jgi:hypothetical protein